ncbi:hypothetical protein HKX48_000897 [Thoreauomyces humboldtii]|nr:hypothetical protein HKX48_000897 [Thoreauomyces humboldtii]
MPAATSSATSQGSHQRMEMPTPDQQAEERELGRAMRTPREIRPADFAGFEAALAEGDRVAAWLKFQDIAVDAEARALLTPKHSAGVVALLIAHKPPKMEFATQVLALQRQMGTAPMLDTYNALLKGYSRMEDLEGARNILKTMTDEGHAPDLDTYNIFLRMYARSGKLDVAMRFFDRMLEEGLAPTVESYNILIAGAAEANSPEVAWRYYQELLDMAYDPDARTYGILIKMHVKNGDMETAEKWFAEMRKKGLKPDLVDYTVMMGGHSRKGAVDKVDILFENLAADGLEPDHYVYNTIIQAKAKNGDLEGAVQAAAKMFEAGVEPDGVTYTTIISAYCQEGKPLEAESLLAGFKATKLYQKRALIPAAYRTIIQHYAKTGAVDDAVRMLLQSEADGFSEHRALHNIVLESAAKAGRVDVLEQLWSRIRYPDSQPVRDRSEQPVGTRSDRTRSEIVRPNQITYNIAIQGFAMADDPETAFEIWKDMAGSTHIPTFETHVVLLEGLVRNRLWADAELVLLERATETSSEQGHFAGHPAGHPVHSPVKTFEDVREALTGVMETTALALSESSSGVEPPESYIVQTQARVIVALYEQLTAKPSPRITEDVFRHAINAYRVLGKARESILVFIALQRHVARHPRDVSSTSSSSDADSPSISAAVVGTLLRAIHETATNATCRAAVDLVHDDRLTLDADGYEYLLYLQLRNGMGNEMVATVMEMNGSTQTTPFTAAMFHRVRLLGSGKRSPGEDGKKVAEAVRTFEEFVQQHLPEVLEDLTAEREKSADKLLSLLP